MSATVDAVPTARSRGLVNAVLRKVATTPVTTWPCDAVELSYPDWIVERLAADLGDDDAVGALRGDERAGDGDRARPTATSRTWRQPVGGRARRRAAGGAGRRPVRRRPGGKATALAAAGARVVAVRRAADPGRARRRATPGALGVDRRRRRRRRHVAAATAPARFDRVLLDAPCSGLGTLRRRADARWRIDADAVDRLAALQRRLLAAAAELVRPGGTLVYSVCTLTREGPDVAADVACRRCRPAAERGEQWERCLLLPQAAGTDGMFLARWTRP